MILMAIAAAASMMAPTSVCAFVHRRQARQQQQQQRQQQYISSSSALTMIATNKNENDIVVEIQQSLLEDGKGHINPELAQRIWKWEQEQRLNLDMRPHDSTRQGLRWVSDMVGQIVRNRNKRSTVSKTTATTRPSGVVEPQEDDRHDDLIQEGVMALMQAMTNYERQARPSQSFEAFAKLRIQHALEDYVVNIGLNQRKRTLSMETTVEISDPLETHYSNQDEWEVREGLVLDNGKNVKPDQLVQGFLDEALQYEGEDQMWVHQQQVAAPLRDSIPEQEQQNDNLYESSSPTPDDLALRDMIRFNVDEFLGTSLEELESQVIQMRFGFDSEDGNPKTQKEVAFELDLTVNKVRKLQKQALQKLRDAYANRYVNNNKEEDDEDNDYWQDSV
jgi:RNA polymerase sigma factor (sigma-70 family)